MKYAALFGVRARHDYYPDAVCRDLSFEPTARTRQLLGGYQMRLRELPDGITVYAPLAADGKSAHIAVRREEVFVFDLRVRNPDFFLFTDPRDLPLKSVELRGGKPMAKPLELRFRARAARWAYYVVTDRRGDLSLADPGDAKLAFGAANLSKNPDESDPVAAALARRYPELQRVRFLSDRPLPCSSAARKGMELRLGGRKVLDAIPRPSISRLSRIGRDQDTLHHVVKYLKAD